LNGQLFQDILLEIRGEKGMSNSSQQRAIQKYRSRLSERGLARFEVLGLDDDRDLIRSLARRLAEAGPDAASIRAAIGRTISGDPPKTGGILAALRRSPLVDSDIDLSRPRVEGRKVDL
jgi:hypothetical protein